MENMGHEGDMKNMVNGELCFSIYRAQIFT